MPRIARADGPGFWHHVTNRAIARRLHDQEMQREREYSVQSAKLVHNALRGWGSV